MSLENQCETIDEDEDYNEFDEWIYDYNSLNLSEFENESEDNLNHEDDNERCEVED